MVKHIVMWNLVEGADGRTKEENFLRIREKARSLLGAIDGLVSIDVYRSYQGMEVALVADMSNREAEQAYQIHPQHLELKVLVTGICKDRASIDFEM